MRSLAIILLLTTSSIATAFDGLPVTVTPAPALTKEPQRPAAQPILPPVQQQRPSQAEPRQAPEERFVQCSEGSTSDGDKAERMFTQVLNFPQPFARTLRSTESDSSFSIFKRGRRLMAKVGGYDLNASVCQNGNRLMVYLVYPEYNYQFHFVVKGVNQNTVHLRQTRSDFGAPINPGEFTRANR